MIRLKRVYESSSQEDGYRILVERLWPRGISKQDAATDLWLKDIAPSPELRKWFSHDPLKWEGFKKRYQAELKTKKELIKLIRQRMKRGTVTFIYASQDTEQNSAVALKE